ncbi:MAG: hypothetical protein N3A01_00180 [Bacteroidales bacterium]|nr:hypothetical protein [Bacteroidales bacterium]
MKASTLITILVLSVNYLLSQNEIKLILTSNDGKLLIKDANIYHLQNAKIKGPKTEKEWKMLYDKISKDSLVKRFEYKGAAVNDERDILMSITSKKEESILRFLKNTGFSKVVLNGKEFGLDQVQEFKNELNALKLKAQSEKMQKNKDSRALPQPRESETKN